VLASSESDPGWHTNSRMAPTPTMTRTVEAASFMKPLARTSCYRPELDVVRFFAFLAVFVYHTLNVPLDHLVGRHVPTWFAQFQVSVSRAGAHGVDLFFVLSAYLITELLIREKETRGSLDERLRLQFSPFRIFCSKDHF
jgi:peptidoglycan/LPS O-acetylase OafA/YrhL